jgi:hypothetical protein
MDTTRRAGLTGGFILILLGLFFLFTQLFPAVAVWAEVMTPQLIVVAVGILLLIIGLIANVPAMAVPACIVGGIGVLLHWQSQTGNWMSWSYMWTLIPGFVGLGTMLMGLWQGKWHDIRAGAGLILISLVFFAIFSSMLGDAMPLARYWPVLLIALGCLSLVQYFVRVRG